LLVASPKDGHNKGKSGFRTDVGEEVRALKMTRWKTGAVTVLALLLVLVGLDRWSVHRELKRVANDLADRAAKEGRAVICVPVALVDVYQWDDPKQNAEMAAFRKMVDDFALAHATVNDEMRIKPDAWENFERSVHNAPPDSMIEIVPPRTPCPAGHYSYSVKAGAGKFTRN
jgi:hypothetical protein